MKNLLPFLKSDVEIQDAAITRGKMTPRCKSQYCSGIKKGLSKQRRAALKRGDVATRSSQFGGEGHSSWWD